MRTTVRLDDDLVRQAKALAARSGKTLTALIEDALREALARRSDPSKPSRLGLPNFRGKGLRAGVDLDDSAGLLDIMAGDQ